MFYDSDKLNKIYVVISMFSILVFHLVSFPLRNASCVVQCLVSLFLYLSLYFQNSFKLLSWKPLCPEQNILGFSTTLFLCIRWVVYLFWFFNGLKEYRVFLLNYKLVLCYIFNQYCPFIFFCRYIYNVHLIPLSLLLSSLYV